MTDSLPKGTLAVSRQQILSEHEDWRAAFMESQPLDVEAAARLRAAPKETKILLVLGTWCSDSRREVTRFWQAEDLQGGQEAMPFEVEMVSLDRSFSAPGFDKEALGVVAVPTFIVFKNGKEVGRLVEVAETSVEADLAALLHGERTGTIRQMR